jgi:putative Mg2+ transporter-C (MgtC) family protein
MPVHLSWHDVILRLIWTVFAGLIIGFNRGEHGRPAGMRTTLLVCLAASISMIQANLLMPTVGKKSDSFIVLDLMRLPLGILSGMGFIGAGAILRKNSLVLGVTTAATLWFTTVMGLCFGGGQIELGIAALVLGIATLWGLKYVESIFRQDVNGTLTLTILKSGPSEEDIRAMIRDSRGRIISWGVCYREHGSQREIRSEIRRRVYPSDTRPPEFLPRILNSPGVEEVSWRPQGNVSDDHVAAS